MKLYDAHCHLNEEHLFPRREECLKNFVDAGWVWIVNAWACQFYNEKGIEIAKSVFDSRVFVKSTVWLHPEVVIAHESTLPEVHKENLQEKIQNLKVMIQENREYVVAVGECGIDLHFPGADATLDLQKELFVAQCVLARELDLPLMVHSRDAFDQTFDILKNYTDLVVYIHCRGYGPEEMKILNSKFPLWDKDKWILNWKLFIGFCGNVTYKKAENIRETLKLVPLESLLLETDAPYLSPQAIRGQMNEPVNVKYVYEFVADFLGVGVEVLVEQLEKNFGNLYSDSKVNFFVD